MSPCLQLHKRRLESQPIRGLSRGPRERCPSLALMPGLGQKQGAQSTHHPPEAGQREGVPWLGLTDERGLTSVSVRGGGPGVEGGECEHPPHEDIGVPTAGPSWNPILVPTSGWEGQGAEEGHRTVSPAQGTSAKGLCVTLGPRMCPRLLAVCWASASSNFSSLLLLTPFMFHPGPPSGVTGP